MSIASLKLSAPLIASLLCAAVTGGAAGADEVPFRVKRGLFALSEPVALGLAPVPGAETVTVFRGGDDGDKFSHAVCLCPFNGWLHAIWQSCPKDEDTLDSRVMWSRSRDGRAWAAPVEIGSAPGDGKHLRGPGGLWSNGRELVAFFLKSDGWSPGTVKITEARVTSDGENWSPLREVTALGTLGTPVPLPGGRMLASIQSHCAPGDPKLYGLPAWTDAPGGLSGWTLAAMPQPKAKHPHYGRVIEPAWFLRGDGRPVMVFRDTSRSGYSLASLGSPDGSAWTEPVVSGLPDSTSLQCAGNLPDGTAYLINNPTGTKERFPLAITLGADGRYFDRAYLVRRTPPPMRHAGYAKTSGFSYPSAVLWGDRLCVAYATNKEDVEITFIPLRSLMLNQGKDRK
ncbi:MAG: exo-alpha-sialidase [Opitutaceae bacterium]|jgi:hypothetical protein|nr:exo-alpha-sialidase [Opitutaceae bacterium]